MADAQAPRSRRRGLARPRRPAAAIVRMLASMERPVAQVAEVQRHLINCGFALRSTCARQPRAAGLAAQDRPRPHQPQPPRTDGAAAGGAADGAAGAGVGQGAGPRPAGLPTPLPAPAARQWRAAAATVGRRRKPQAEGRPIIARRRNRAVGGGDGGDAREADGRRTFSRRLQPPGHRPAVRATGCARTRPAAPKAAGRRRPPPSGRRLQRRPGERRHPLSRELRRRDRLRLAPAPMRRAND